MVNVAKPIDSAVVRPCVVNIVLWWMRAKRVCSIATHIFDTVLPPVVALPWMQLHQTLQRPCGMRCPRWRQIRCGDLYADKAVEAFTACAVSDKKCVPQRVDADAFPVPKDDALDQSFDVNNFQVLYTGVWHPSALVSYPTWARACLHGRGIGSGRLPGTGRRFTCANLCQATCASA